MERITKEITLYTFDELSEETKEIARNWFREGLTGEFEQECTLDDAKAIGLDIIELSQHRANKGKFIEGAVECAQAIIEDHGKECETYKTARSFLESLDSLNVEYPEDEEGYRSEAYEDEKEDLEKEFLQSLLSDYQYMLDKDIGYQNSDEAVDENIRANGYTFRENGKRED